MAREYCPHCDYPSTTCLCDAVENINSYIAFDVLQHPSETKVAKNTARILKLCHPLTTIWKGETEADFTLLKHSLDASSNQIFVLYPSKEAWGLQQIRCAQATNSRSIRILLIDGTWKKAFKIHQLNSWLKAYPHIRIDELSSQYIVRKSVRVKNSLSTLEAAKHCIDTLDPSSNTLPLLNCLSKMQSHYLQRARKNYT